MSNPFEPPVTGQHFNRHEKQKEDWFFAVSGLEDQTIQEERPYYQFKFMAGLLVVVLLIFTFKLLQLQVTSGSQWRNLSAGNSVRVQLTPADRGLIYDSSGKILAQNTKRSTVSIRITDLPKEEPARNELYQKIEKIISISGEQKNDLNNLRTKVTGNYLIATNLSKEQYLLLKELSNKEPAVVVGEQAVRSYENVTGLAHLLGYVGQVSEEDLANGYSSIELIGKTGLEKVYEQQLRGLPGVQHFEVDSKGVIAHRIASDQNRQPQTGRGLQLSVDIELQRKIGEILKTAIDKRNKEFGETPELGASVIVMNPQNGQIKALVSLPDYDNNLFAKGITKDELQNLYNDPRKPLFNRATAGTYPPGSTIKPLIAAGALQYNIVSPNYAFDTPPSITIGSFNFPDWKDHGVTDIRTAIAESNNIFFYMLGGGYENVRGLGLNRIREILQWFGFEQPTGIDLDHEGKGFILSEEWKRKTAKEPVYLGDVYHLSIGQGDVTATPLEMTAATAAIANGGTLYAPRLSAAFTNASGQVVENINSTIKSQLPIDGQKLQIVREGMRQAVLTGSSRPLSTLSKSLAGKTGTAQFGNQGKTHAWFTGFGPTENPEVVVTVLIEGGGGSFEAAIPVAEEVFRAYFNESAAQ